MTQFIFVRGTCGLMCGSERERKPVHKCLGIF